MEVFSMKKTLKILLFTITVISLFSIFASASEAKALTWNDFEYSLLSDGSVEINGYTGTATKLTVPKKIADKKVTSIGQYAFAYNKTLTQVTIPGTVEKIDKAAFYYINSLKKVTIKDGVKSIGTEAFCDCCYLNSVTMTDSVTKIGSRAFESCPKLSKITFSKNLTSIGADVVDNTKFYKNKNNWENNIMYVNTYVLAADIPNIKGAVKIKEGTTLIADGAFSISSLKYHNNITSVTIPNTVVTIGNFAFSDCHALKKIIIPKSVKSIGNSAFYNCENLSKLTLSNGVQTIGNNAFYNTGLKSVVIPASVKKIGDKAFGYVFYVNSSNMGVEAIRSEFSIKGYAGSAAETYADKNKLDFIPATPKAPTVKIIAGNNLIKVKYNKTTGATGFQVSYIYKNKTYTKNFNADKTVTKTISGLKEGSYTVKVRSYAKADGKTVYSAWTTAKSITVK